MNDIENDTEYINFRNYHHRYMPPISFTIYPKKNEKKYIGNITIFLIIILIVILLIIFVINILEQYNIK